MSNLKKSENVLSLKVELQHTLWEKILANHISDKGLISRTHKKKPLTTHFLKVLFSEQKISIGIFPKKKIYKLLKET